LSVTASHATRRLADASRSIWGGLDKLVDTSADKWAYVSLESAAWVYFPVALAGLAAALISGFSQTKGLFTMKPLTPKFSKLNPFPKLKTLFFSKQSIATVLMSIGKVAVIAGFTIQLFLREIDHISTLGHHQLIDVMFDLAWIIVQLVLRVIVLLGIFAAIDYVLAVRRHEEQIKMTKQEVKQEHREQEGDPQIKGKRRQKQREMAQQRMMADIPKADVILVNPTHYSIALSYDIASMGAPKVLAKGKDQVAARIREIARKSGIPVIHNPPLTRAIYADVEVGGEVSPQFYTAVAEVLAFVYRTLGGRRAHTAFETGRRS
jgi:flagellar biosynthetic protein FlhB